MDQFIRYLQGACLVRVYSDPVRRRVEPINPHVEAVTGSLDWSLVPERLASPDPGRVRIVYATSRLKDELADMFLPAIEDLLDRRAGAFEISFWGYHPRALRGRPGVRFLPLEPDYDRFLGRLARGGFEIGLAPLLDDEFHRSKTNNKFREYGACGIAGVYSDVDVYASCVEQGETGLLVAPEPSAWRSAIERLIDEPALRLHIRTAAREYVRTHYSQSAAEDEWLGQIVVAREQARVMATPVGQPPRATADVVARPTSGLAQWLAALPAKGVRLARRLRDTGIRPTASWAYRYLHGLLLLRRIRRQLASTQR
jgi:hypothetical protein